MVKHTHPLLLCYGHEAFDKNSVIQTGAGRESPQGNQGLLLLASLDVAATSTASTSDTQTMSVSYTLGNKIERRKVKMATSHD